MGKEVRIVEAEEVAAPATGRPSSYKEEYATQAKNYCTLGATDAELAEIFGVDVRTIYRWQIQFPAFCQALKVGKEAADERVERSLFHRAVGYTHEATKIMTLTEKTTENEVTTSVQEVVAVPYQEHVPPDVTAGIFWLKNRRRKRWTQDQQQGGAVTNNFNFSLKIGEDSKSKNIEAVKVLDGEVGDGKKTKALPAPRG